MAKRKKNPYAARIQNAVYGFRIPMLSIPKLYRELEAACEGGADDAKLKAIIAAFPGVEVT